MDKTVLLSNLKPGQTGTVRNITHDTAMSRRMQDIGLVIGTKVKCVGKSPLGDPCAYFIRGAVIAIRGVDGEKVEVSVKENTL